MDEYGNPIPGSSKEFESEEIMDTTAACDFAWLESEFSSEDMNAKRNTNLNLDNSYNFKTYKVESSPENNIDNFFEEIKTIDFSQNLNSMQNNNIFLELLERCNNLIDIVGRNIVYLEDMMSATKNNIEISKRNATKAHKVIKSENQSMSKTLMLKLKKKSNLANFFKIGLSNCPHNPHLMELYEHGRLILSYNGRFILEECIDRNLWNQEFKNKLEKAIHEEVLDKLKIPMLGHHLRLGKDRMIQEDSVIKHKIELEINDIEKEIEIISKTPFKSLVFQFMDPDTKYDWLRIAKLTNKPHLQCQRFWNLLLTPHGSRAKWTEDEDNKLVEIATKYGERNWRQIANELDTRRNELQCFIRYQKYKKNVFKKGKWSKEEDLKLMTIIKENTHDKLINWQKVYFAMHDEGRSVDQIYNRWMFSLKPGIKKGYLNEREKFIINAAQKKNLPASVVSMNLTNRTANQIRNAYRRNLTYDQDIFRGGWIPEEDKMLLNAVNQYAPKEFTWSQVSEQVPGRNSEQCRHRFKLIEKRVQLNPELTVDNFPRSKQSYKCKELPDLPDDIILDEKYFVEHFKQNRQLLKESKKPVETVADRKLKKAFLDNAYVTKHCNFASKCDFLKHVLDYLGADLRVPQEFVHKDDLKDEGLMSMMTYLKEYSTDMFTLKSKQEEQYLINQKLDYEGVDGVLRTSDIINSDLSEVAGLFDIRMRNVVHVKSESIENHNSFSKTKKPCSLPLYSKGFVPPNFETFKMLYAYMNSLNTCLKTDFFKDTEFDFDWNDEESKKLHQRLVSIFKWPALFSGMVDYKAAKLNMIISTEQTTDSTYTEARSFHYKKRKPNFNLKKFL